MANNSELPWHGIARSALLWSTVRAPAVVGFFALTPLTDTLDSPITLGWREHLELPELGLNGLKAKIDTGAKTSALHAFRVEPLSQDGEDWVQFWIHPLRKHRDVVVVCRAPIVDRRVVSDSGGHKESRIVISTTLALQGYSWPIEVTLTNRDSMIFPMLLGRSAMEGRVLVDPSQSYVLGREMGRAFRRSLLNQSSNENRDSLSQL